MPELSIVIVNYNTPDFTAQCLESLRRNPARASCEIIVVDNASIDDSVIRLRAYPEIRLLRSDRNRGIAGGNNLGIEASTGNYVLLLNNDTIVLPGTLDQVVDFLAGHADAGGVGGQLINPDGSFQASYNDFPSFKQLMLMTTKLSVLFCPSCPSHGPETEMHIVDWIGSAFVLFRREALVQVGLVEEDYFIYCDETDLQLRMKTAGWNIYYLPAVKTIHFGGRSLNPWRRRRLVYRGYLLFFDRHFPRRYRVAIRALFVAISLPKLIFWSLARGLPRVRQRAIEETDANRAIVQMSLRGEVGPP